jgi:hypothetical protein
MYIFFFLNQLKLLKDLAHVSPKGIDYMIDIK